MEQSWETQNCKKVTLRENLVKVLNKLIDLRKLILNCSICNCILWKSNLAQKFNLPKISMYKCME